MSTEDRERIEAAFDEALQRDPETRLAWLRTAYPNDDALYREVEALLEAHERSLVALDELRDDAAAFRAVLEETVAPPEKVGPYEIIRVLGQGGMGTVYLARRSDIDKLVALKLVHGAAYAPALRARFLHERRILARLEHPGIARLLDAGIMPDGSPFFAMEYVEGEPITTFCRARRLPVPARLELFRQVCEAVQYAHHNLVIHRDLKPGNILVSAVPGGAPRVKLLDFGIAKIMEEDTHPGAAQLTHTGMRVMTPQYAAPEQVRGEAVTTATDVYALGLLLFELLTDALPYRVDGLSASQVERMVSETIPPRPSAMVGATGTSSAGDLGSVRKLIRGDLDAIVLMALCKEPERRYASAEAMLEDIRRYADGRPVRARQETVGYRMARFIGRHRLGVMVAAAFVLMLSGYAITVTMQARQVRNALENERREAEKANQVTEFLLSLFEANDPGEAQGEDVTARELLARGRQQAEMLANQPEVQAQMLDVIGRVYQSLGSYDEAQPLLERALAQRRATLGTMHAETAKSMENLAVLFFERGDYVAAESLHTQALGVYRALYGREHAEVASSLNNLAGALYGQGRAAEAESLHWQALAMQRRVIGPEHLDVAYSLNNLAVIHSRRGDYAAAESLQRSSLAIRRKILGDSHPDVARSLNNLGVNLRRQGKLAEAEAVQRETLALRRRLLGEEHPEVAISMTNLAAVLREQERYAEAEDLLRQAIDMARRLLGEEHPYVAAMQVTLAETKHDQKAYQDAERLYLEALARLQHLLGTDHTETQACLRQLIDLYEAWGRPDRASPYRAMLSGT